MFNRTNVVAGHTYYYKLEDVELDGTSTRHGPIEVVAIASSPFAFASLVAPGRADRRPGTGRCDPGAAARS